MHAKAMIAEIGFGTLSSPLPARAQKQVHPIKVQVRPAPPPPAPARTIKAIRLIESLATHATGTPVTF